MLGILEQQKMVKEAIAKFPKEFGLRAFPGKIFIISEAASFVNDGVVMLYTYVSKSNDWEAFAKGTVEELQNNIVLLNDERLEAKVGAAPFSSGVGPKRLSVERFREIEEMQDEVVFQTFIGEMVANGKIVALCEKMCEVELDGTCPHGHPSITMAMGIS